MVTLTDTTPEAVADLLTLSSVCGVMEDAVIHAFADDDLVVPWGLDRIDQLDLPLDSSYATNNDLTGSGVDVYIMVRFLFSILVILQELNFFLADLGLELL